MTTMEQELADHAFFAGLDGDAMRLLAGCAVNVGFRGDDYVFKEGEPADRFYVIRHGRIAIEVHGTRRRPNGHRHGRGRGHPRMVLAGAARTAGCSTPARSSRPPPSAWTANACGTSAKPTPGWATS